MESTHCWLSLLLILLSINKSESTQDTTGWVIYSETDTLVAYAHEVLNAIEKSNDEGYFANYLLNNITNNYLEIPQLIRYYDINVLNKHSCINPIDFVGISINMPKLRTIITDNNLQLKKNCNIRPSINQYIYDIYNILILRSTDISIKKASICKKNTHYVKGIMVKYTQHIIDEMRSVCFNNVIDEFHNFLKRFTNKFHQTLNGLSRDIYRHDPVYHERGVTYEVLNGSTWNYGTFEMCLNRNAGCENNCWTPTNIHFNDSIEHVDASYLTCTRKSSDCKIEKSQDETYNEIWKTCDCICDEINSSQSIQYINLRPQYTNTAEGFVVTGIRFRVINRVLYLQVQEGQLKRGRIDKDTVAWKDVNATEHNYENNLDLFRLNYDYPTIDLTETTLPSTHALTMVKFSATMNALVHLEIQGFRLIDGELDAVNSQMLTNSSQLTNSGIQAEYTPVNVNIPTVISSHNTNFSEPNKYFMRFHSVHDDKDTGHILLPFIDIQDVVTAPPTSIVGVGIHLRYGRMSSGFLAPKIIGIDNRIKIEHLIRQCDNNFTAVEY